MLFVFSLLGCLTGLAGLNQGSLEQGKLIRNAPGDGELETEAVFCLPQETSATPSISNAAQRAILPMTSVEI